MRVLLVALVASAFSIQAGAWVESLRGATFQTCNGKSCFKLRARSMERSLFAPYYFARGVSLQQVTAGSGKVVKNWKTDRGLYDFKGNRWILLKASGGHDVCLNAETGTIEKFR